MTIRIEGGYMYIQEEGGEMIIDECGNGIGTRIVLMPEKKYKINTTTGLFEEVTDKQD